MVRAESGEMSGIDYWERHVIVIFVVSDASMWQEKSWVAAL